jgi:hypothetical protein
VHGAPFDKLRANVVHTLPLITRTTEHSGVTFGAATSVLLTVTGDTFGVRRYKKSLALGPSPTGRGKVKCCGRSGSESRVGELKRV